MVYKYWRNGVGLPIRRRRPARGDKAKVTKWNMFPHIPLLKNRFTEALHSFHTGARQRANKRAGEGRLAVVDVHVRSTKVLDADDAFDAVYRYGKSFRST